MGAWRPGGGTRGRGTCTWPSAWRLGPFPDAGAGGGAGGCSRGPSSAEGAGRPRRDGPGAAIPASPNADGRTDGRTVWCTQPMWPRALGPCARVGGGLCRMDPPPDGPCPPASAAFLLSLHVQDVWLGAQRPDSLLAHVHMVREAAGDAPGAGQEPIVRLCKDVAALAPDSASLAGAGSPGQAGGAVQ